MSRQQMKRNAGRLVLVFVDDGMGRRLVIGDVRHGMVDRPRALAMSKTEALNAITAIRDFMVDLPEVPDSAPSETT